MASERRDLFLARLDTIERIESTISRELLQRGGLQLVGAKTVTPPRNSRTWSVYRKQREPIHQYDEEVHTMSIEKKPHCFASRIVLALAMMSVLAGRQAPAQAPPGVRLPVDLNNGIVFFEAYGDNRPTNTLNPGPTRETPLKYGGMFEGHNGSAINIGPLFMSEVGFYPYVQLDQQRNLLLLHPGTFDTANLGACVSVFVPKDGLYNISGSFARANNFQLAGDGVDVAVFTNFNAGTPLYSAAISSNHLVNAEDPFSGTGVSQFSLQASLTQGDVLRFAVFSGPQAQDGTFDITALQLNFMRLTRR
jgi:hypothetical protein